METGRPLLRSGIDLGRRRKAQDRSDDILRLDFQVVDRDDDRDAQHRAGSGDEQVLSRRRSVGWTIQQDTHEQQPPLSTGEIDPGYARPWDVFFGACARRNQSERVDAKPNKAILPRPEIHKETRGYGEKADAAEEKQSIAPRDRVAESAKAVATVIVMRCSAALGFCLNSTAVP